ncbi:MAG: hypothetical protein ACK4QW_11400 [Alphaproteobacteria bacterium]
MNAKTLTGNLLLGSALALGIGLAPAAAVAQGAPIYGQDYRSGAPMPTTGAIHQSTLYATETRPVGSLMPSETAPPDAIRDPAVWAQWQKHSQYEYERGYEAGRQDAMTYMRAGMMEDRMGGAHATGTSAALSPPGSAGTMETRMSERREGMPPPPAGTTATGEWWMNDWQRIASDDWPRAQEEIRRRWPQLSGYDLERIQGQRDMLLAILQERYNLSNERAHEQVVAWQRQRS